MSTQIGADFGSLDRTQTQLVKTVNDMNTKLANLKSYLAPMVAEWEGDAATNYNALQAKWDTSASELNTVLQRISTALASTSQDFAATEKANAARF